jgi:hypothetical protein
MTTKRTHETQGADMTTPASPRTGVHRTDTALSPETDLEVMVSRALDQELEWYFSYGEGAMRHATIPVLPSYAAVPADSSDEAIQARAVEIATAVRSSLMLVGRKRAEILRAAYTPRSWPRPVKKAFGPLAAIVVRLAFADDPWPDRNAREGLEQAAATRLGGRVIGKSTPLARLRKQAKRLLGGAIVSYARMRGLTPGALAARAATGAP